METKEIKEQLESIHLKYSGTIEKYEDIQKLKDLILDDIYLLIKEIEKSQ